jgi:hypothetical protein
MRTGSGQWTMSPLRYDPKTSCAILLVCCAEGDSVSTKPNQLLLGLSGGQVSTKGFKFGEEGTHCVSTNGFTRVGPVDNVTTTIRS